MGRQRQMQMMKHVSDAPEQRPMTKNAAQSKRRVSGGRGRSRGNLFGAVLSFVQGGGGGNRKRRNKPRAIDVANKNRNKDDGSPSSQVSFFSGGTSVSGGVSSESSTPCNNGTVVGTPPPPPNTSTNRNGPAARVVAGGPPATWNARSSSSSSTKTDSDSDGSSRGVSGSVASGGGGDYYDDAAPPPSYNSLCLPPRIAASGARYPITEGRAYKGHILSRGSHRLVSPAIRGGGGGGRGLGRVGSGRSSSGGDKRMNKVRSEKMPSRFGSHASAADIAILRAANGGHLSVTEKALVGVQVQRKKKASVHEMEKIFIRSLGEVDEKVWAIKNKHAPPLLGHIPRPQRYGSLAGPQAADKRRHGGGGEGAGSMVVPLGPKKTLVLDLDETLVSSSRTARPCDYKIVFKIHYKDAPSDHATFAANADAPATISGGGGGGSGEDADNDSNEDVVREICYFVRLRPGLAKFLQKAAALYELVIWTASGKSYADAIIDLIDPRRTLFTERLYRESCQRHRGLCVKDLRQLGRPMDSVLLLDNYVYSFGLTLDNGIPISPWTGAEDAKESGLLTAYSVLKRIAKVPDIRTPLIKAFDLHRKVHGERPPSLSTSPGTTLITLASEAPPPSPCDGFAIKINRGGSAQRRRLSGGKKSPQNGFRPSSRVSPPRERRMSRSRSSRRYEAAAAAAAAAERASRDAKEAAVRAEAEAVLARTAVAIAMVGRTGGVARGGGGGDRSVFFDCGDEQQGNGDDDGGDGEEALME